MSFVTGFFDNIPSKLPIQTLVEENLPINIISSSINATIDSKDDKSVTVFNVSIDTAVILDIMSEYANRLNIKTMTHKDSNMLIVRTSPEILKSIVIGKTATFENIHLCLVQKGTNGIVFLLSDSIHMEVIDKEDNTYSSYKGSKIRTTLENREPYTPKTKKVVDKLIHEEKDVPDLDYQPRSGLDQSPLEVDPKLLELVEQLIQAINRIADALERIEEKLEKSNKF